MNPRRVVPACAILLILGSGLAAQHVVEPTAGYAEAVQLYRSGDAAGAATILEGVIDAEGGVAAHHALLGWCRLRLTEIDAAGEAFDAALRIDPGSSDALAGGGYVDLRRGRAAAAARSFRSSLELQPDSAEAWKGLGLALRRDGDDAGAREAFTRAVELGPSDEESRALLDESLKVLVRERRPRESADHSLPLRVVSRARDARFQVRDGGRWRSIFVKGINLGTSLPGRFPAEFPDDGKLYRDWLDRIGELGANVVRLYTLHPPSLYRALAEHNRDRPGEKLWLVQGVWTELPPGDDYDDAAFAARFHDEIRRVIDAVHGNLALPPRPGHAHGIYDEDVSGDVLAYLLGREWEPFSVDAFNRLRPAKDRFDGRYVRTAAAQPIEVWLASIVETAAAHETEYYRTQHPVSWVSWPTLDPLHHPTEATVAEEMRFRPRPLDSPRDEVKEYDNDLVQVDATRIEATEAFPAGLFASYHAYPYYPEFMLLDPGYGRVRDAHGVSRYLGYLQALKRHHGDQPVLIAEFGVPTSRGVAHLHPEGQHHGGHTTTEQGEIDARLMRNMHQAGMAGGILFAWMDEWFKRNWLVMNYESPRERNPRWLSALDAEQNFGLLAALPGTTAWKVVLDGDDEDWSGVPPLYERAAAEPVPPAGVRSFRVTADEAYLYLGLQLEPRDDRLDRGELEYWIGVDTYDPARGDRRLPEPVARSVPIGMEFLIRFADRESSRILVARSYDLFTQRNRRPYRSAATESGDFIEIRTFTNRERWGRDGTYYAAKGYSRSPLRHGTTDPGSPDHDSLADWFAGNGGRLIEARIPWGLLNVGDPSSRRVIHDGHAIEGVVETVVTEGFRFQIVALRNAGERSRIVDMLPTEDTGLDGYPLWAWPVWDHPTYRLELKPSYTIFGKTLGELED